MRLDEGCSYAVRKGDYVGEIFVYIRKTNATYDFLSIPKMENRYVPSEKLKFGLNEKILDFVERIPKDVFYLVKAQFEKNASRIK